MVSVTRSRILGDAAADFRLHAHGGDEEAQTLLGDAPEHVLERFGKAHAQLDLIDHQLSSVAIGSGAFSAAIWTPLSSVFPAESAERIKSRM